MKAWFISDIHIKELNERNSQKLLRFLLEMEEGKWPSTHLFFLGDIFDFWVGDHPYYAQKFAPFVQIVEKIAQSGIQIFYVEGNHDVHVSHFWQRYGVEAFVEDKYFTIDGVTLRLTHGDLMNPDDHTYLKYRDFIRRPGMNRLADLIPASPLEWIGKQASLRSRGKSFKSRTVNEDDLRLKIRNYAIKSFREKPFDWIISGHMHVRDQWQGSDRGQNFKSLNLGSWFQESHVFWINDQSSGWLDVETGLKIPSQFS